MEAAQVCKRVSTRHQELLIRDRVPLEFVVCQKLGARARHVRRVLDAIAATDKTTTTCARCLILSRRRSRTTILCRERFKTWTHHEPMGRFQGGNSVWKSVREALGSRKADPLSKQVLSEDSTQLN